MNAIGKINSGEPMTGSADIASQVPLPYFALVPALLRSADPSVLRFLDSNEIAPSSTSQPIRRNEPVPQTTAPTNVPMEPPVVQPKQTPNQGTSVSKLDQIEDVSVLDVPEELV